MKKTLIAASLLTVLSASSAMADDSLKITQGVNENICNVSADSLTQTLDAVDYNTISAEPVTGSLMLSLENCANGQRPVITVSTDNSSTSGLSLMVGNREGSLSDPATESVNITGSTAAAGASEATMHYSLSLTEDAKYADVVGDHDFTLTLAHSYN